MQIGIINRDNNEYIEAKDACFLCTINDLKNLREFIKHVLEEYEDVDVSSGEEGDYLGHSHFSLFCDDWRPSDSDIEIAIYSGR